MEHEGPLEELRRLEVELHQLETRRNRARLDALLHPDFREIGRSGREYSREEVLSEFADVGEYPSIASKAYRLHTWAPDVALLTYISAHRGAGGTMTRCTLRSSLWVNVAGRWRLAFHQGTPAADRVWDAT